MLPSLSHRTATRQREQLTSSIFSASVDPTMSSTACSNSRCAAGSHSLKISNASQIFSPPSSELCDFAAPTIRQMHTNNAAWLLVRAELKNTSNEVGDGPRNRSSELNIHRRRSVTSWSGVRPLQWQVVLARAPCARKRKPSCMRRKYRPIWSSLT